MMTKIGLLGGAGNVGRYALEYLASTGKFALEAASRSITSSQMNLENVKLTDLDVNDDSALADFVSRNDMILNLVPSAVRSGVGIARICTEKGVPLADAGTAEGYEEMGGNCIYSAGAIPGFSAPLAVYAAKDFDKVGAFTHICSMSGVFSFGAAYDYLKGVVGGSAQESVKQIPSAEIPFVGTGSLTSYSDNETSYVCRRLGVQGEHFVSFGGNETSSILKRAAMTFSSDKVGSAKKLVEMSKMYNIKTNEHFAFIIEVKGEKNGREYIFISDDERLKLHKEGKVIEERVYHTVFGDWYYFTVADEGLDINGEDNYFVINTLEAFLKYREYFGEDRVIPIYVEVTPEIRMKRALEREGRQVKPSIDEVKRRFAADDVDFAEEKLADAGITNRFSNDGDIDECFLEIKKLIKGKL